MNLRPAQPQKDDQDQPAGHPRLAQHLSTAERDVRWLTPDPQRIQAIAEAGLRMLQDAGGSLATAPNFNAPHRVAEFVAHYLKHESESHILNRSEAELAAALLSHIELGLKRAENEIKIAILSPQQTEAWAAGNCVQIQVVSKDRPFIVDTILQTLDDEQWNVNEVIHPQFGSIRDADGVLQDMAHRSEGRQTVRESWVWVEARAPFGVPTEDAIASLRAHLEAAFADLTLAVDDSEQMRGSLLALADRQNDPVDADMLRWLANDMNFTIFGAREYAINASGEFKPLPGGLGILRDDERAAGRFHAVPNERALDTLIIAKDSEVSQIRQSRFLDYIGVRKLDEQGVIVGEHRYLGLFTNTANAHSVFTVPFLARRAEEVLAAAGFDKDSYGEQALIGAIEEFPRDELLHASVAELVAMLTEIVGLGERRQVRSFTRSGRWNRFFSVLIYLPRDRYNTALRERLLQIVSEAVQAHSMQWRVAVTESVLARLYITLTAQSGEVLTIVDEQQLKQALEQAVSSWEDEFSEGATSFDSAERGIDFSDAYKQTYSPGQALVDLRSFNEISGPEDMRLTLYRPSDPDDRSNLRLKVLRVDSQMNLSRVIPILNSLGVEIVDERPFDLMLREHPAYVYDFGLQVPDAPTVAEPWGEAGRLRFTAAFEAMYRGLLETDAFNRLVTITALSWQQVSVLRTLARYLRQAGVGLSQSYIADTMAKYPQLAIDIVQIFETMFDPESGLDNAARSSAVAQLRAGIDDQLAQITSLDEDRIIRQLLDVIAACVRTNYFALDFNSGDALVLKLLPEQIAFLPQPRPKFELFVYGARVEGVHLRFGKVARGGLRWTDRAEDYRTEVLGLVKAQMVKNAVIVPVGAKGGFLPHKLAGLSGAQRIAEGQDSYRVFIRGLLSVTDNMIEGQIVHPHRVYPLDEDDPYLVVAADKGTAKFSDTANAIALEQGFWLGDAFASGGSKGFDHKGMGITARGAWESAKRHLGELGIDQSTDDFTVVGIGDMAGDVFGNGMLLSEHIRLVAAFNHEAVFVDPTPDAARSYLERERLFEMPGSRWFDYDRELISAGGGVFERSAKSVTITPQMRQALGLSTAVPDQITPNELISLALQAPVDLLWNGGIGTYVKASSQTHEDVGDKANNPVRINGGQVRARAAVEGGNLGWTQLGRVEYALTGGKINTDFIDNSAGVDTSDHEVNIKILLASEIKAGRLSEAERDELLAEMTPQVASLVLAHNQSQNRALAAAVAEATEMAAAHEDLMNTLTAEGYLDRDLEGLPSSDELAERVAGGKGLTNPELASLLAWTKISIQDAIFDTDLPDDPYLAERLDSYFPPLLRDRFADRYSDHQLAREIITTVAVNRFVDSQGITAAHRLRAETGASVDDVIRAQLAARNLFDAGWLEVTISRSELPEQIKTTLRSGIQRLIERATRWLLHEWRGPIDIEQIAADYKEPVRQVLRELPQLLTPQAAQKWQDDRAILIGYQVPEELADRMAGWPLAHLALPITRLSQSAGRELADVARAFFSASELSGIWDVFDYSGGLDQSSRWAIVARSGVRDQLQGFAEQLTSRVLDSNASSIDHDSVEQWWTQLPAAQRVRGAVRETMEGPVDLARVTVALRLLRGLL